MDGVNLAYRLRFLQAIKGLPDAELAWMREAMVEEEQRRAQKEDEEWTST